MTYPRVLFITGEYPPLRGGIADYLKLLRQELQTQGIYSIVLSASGSEGKGVSTVSRWGWSVVRNIQKLVDHHDIDIVHIQFQTGAFNMHPAINALPMVLGTRKNIPVVTTFHDLRAPYLFPKAGRLRIAVIKKMARSSRIVVVTNPQDEATLNDAGIDTLQVPIGPSLPKPNRPRSPLPGATVAYFGFPSREKGIYTLIESLGALTRDRRPTLKIIGAGQPDAGTHSFSSERELRSAAERYGVIVHTTGFLPPQQASNELNDCQVIALPYVDGASLRSSALIAALNTGRPVVATISQQGTGLKELQTLPQLVTTPARDIPMFTAALEDAIEHGTEAADLPDRFSWRWIADSHRSLYQSAAGGELP